MDRLTQAQIRGARGMLHWSMLDLAQASGISVSTVKRAECGERSSAPPPTVRAIRQALEAAGVQFLADDGSGAGMRLGPRHTPDFSRFL